MKKVIVDLVKAEFDWKEYQKKVVDKQVKKSGSMVEAIVNLEARVADLKATCEGKQDIMNELMTILLFAIKKFSEARDLGEVGTINAIIKRKVEEYYEVD